MNYSRGPPPCHPDRMRDATSAKCGALARAVAAPPSSSAGFWSASRASARGGCQSILACRQRRGADAEGKMPFCPQGLGGAGAVWVRVGGGGWVAGHAVGLSPGVGSGFRWATLEPLTLQAGGRCLQPSSTVSRTRCLKNTQVFRPNVSLKGRKLKLLCNLAQMNASEKKKMRLLEERASVWVCNVMALKGQQTKTDETLAVISFFSIKAMGCLSVARCCVV